MVIILFGVQDLMLKSTLKKVTNEQIKEINEFNFVTYNALECEILDVMYEATLMPLGEDKRVIVVENASFLSAEKVKKNTLSKEQEKAIIDYIKIPNDATELIFIVHNEKIDDKSPIVKLVKEKGRIIEAMNPSDKDWIKYAEKLFANYGISASYNVIDEFTKRTNKDAMLMNNEIKKLALYSNNITMSDLDLFVARPLEDKILNLCTLIVTNKKKEAISLYRDLLVKNEEPVAMISLIATQLRLFVDVFTLNDAGLSQGEIANELNIHPYRIKLAIDNRRYIRLSALKNEIENLYQLDYDIKSGKVDRFYGLEMFILNFNKID